MADTKQTAAGKRQLDAEADAAKGTPLDERQREANEQGYVGKDATDLADADGDGVDDVRPVDLSQPQYGGIGIPGVPGGHPADPTVGSYVGSGGDPGTYDNGVDEDADSSS